MRRLSRQRNIAAPLFRVAKKLKGNETGLGLIETLVALAILGSIAVVFLSGLATTAKATLIVDKRATAESITRSQIEYVQGQDYIDYSTDPHDVYDEIAPPPGSGYSIDFAANPIIPATGLSYGQTGGIFDQDQGIQKITVTVNRDDKSVLTIEGYKVRR